MLADINIFLDNYLRSIPGLKISYYYSDEDINTVKHITIGFKSKLSNPEILDIIYEGLKNYLLTCAKNQACVLLFKTVDSPSYFGLSEIFKILSDPLEDEKIKIYIVERLFGIFYFGKDPEKGNLFNIHLIDTI